MQARRARHGGWRRAALLALALAAGPSPAGRAAPSAPAPEAAYLHARRALAAPPDAAALLPAAQQDPAAFLGHVLEVTATVHGLMSDGAQQTLILTTDPAEGGVTLSARVAAALGAADWADSGSRLRALVRVDRAGNDQSLSSLTLLAAAPEAEVAQAERLQAALDGARLRAVAARRAQTASRALPYRRQSPSRPPAYAASAPDAGGGPVAPLSAAARNVYAPYRAAIARLNPRLTAPALDTITTSVLFFSERERIDPRLTMAMIIAESGFDVTSTSRTGAMGLGQLMPGTARGLGVVNAYDPVQNIGAAVHLLRGHLDQYGGRLSLTMAAYNAGPGAVRKYHGVPPYRETQRYVAKVASLYRQLCGG